MPPAKIVINKTRAVKYKVLINDNRIRHALVNIIASERALNLVIR